MLGETMPSITKDMDLYSYRLPLGVCAGIAPFNFPAMIPLWMFPMAMVCGNTFLMKPSERVPGATMLLAKLLQDSGAPDGALNIIHGQHEGNYFMWLLFWLPKKLRCSLLIGNFNVYLCSCDSLCVCHIYVGTQRGQIRALELLKLEFQVSVRCPVWVLKTEFISSGRVRSILNHWAIFPALWLGSLGWGN